MWTLVFVGALVVHAILLASSLKRPFVGLNEDDNAVFGLGALNLARFGFTTLRFGIAHAWYDDVREIGTSFYTHHPQWVIVPSAILFRLFGVSDAATRLPSMLLSLVSLAALYGAVRRMLGSARVAALAACAYAVLPGVVHYSSTLSEKAFVLAFSCLLYLAFLGFAARPTAARKALLLLVLLAGGLVGWHFAFAAGAVWLWTALDRGIPQRRLLLVSIPLVSAATIAANFVHFYLLKGGGAREIFEYLAIRSHPVESLGALGRYALYASLGFTWVGAVAGAGALVLAAVLAVRARRLDPALLFAVQPLLVLLFFQEWATVHGFGPLFWAPFVALAIGRGLDALIDRPGALGRTAAAVIAVAFVMLAWNDLKRMRQPVLLTPADVALLRRFGAEVPAGARIAMGEDYRGFCSPQLAEWYMRREAHRLDWRRDRPDYIVTFTPRLGGPFAEQAEAMARVGYREAATQDYVVILHGP